MYVEEIFLVIVSRCESEKVDLVENDRWRVGDFVETGDECEKEKEGGKETVGQRLGFGRDRGRRETCWENGAVGTVESTNTDAGLNEQLCAAVAKSLK